MLQKHAHNNLSTDLGSKERSRTKKHTKKNTNFKGANEGAQNISAVSRMNNKEVCGREGQRRGAGEGGKRGEEGRRV